MSVYNDLSDEQLVKHAKRGEQSAYSEIFDRYKEIVKIKARTFYIAGGDNDDIIQEGMIGLFNAVRDYDGEKGFSFSTFAGICIERQIATAIKKASSKKNSPLNTSVPMPEDDNSKEANETVNPESILIDRERAEGMENSLRTSLSRFENLVLDMLLEGMKYDEIAEEMGISRKSSDNAIQRIKRKMKMLKGE